MGTTTFKKRSSKQLEILRKTALSMGMRNPVILDYGPGGVVRYFSEVLSDENRGSWSSMYRLRRGAFKILERGLRASHLFELETFEPREIADALSDLDPYEMHVIDQDPRVIRAVKRIDGLPFRVYAHLANIDDFQVPEQGDIVVVYNVLQKLKNTDRTLEAIANATKAGGLLSITAQLELPNFEKIDTDLYRKNSD